MTCEHCGCTSINWIDEGIGAYEYWGAKEVDIDMVPVCAECGEPVKTNQDYRSWLEDRKADFCNDFEESDFYENLNYGIYR